MQTTMAGCSSRLASLPGASSLSSPSKSNKRTFGSVSFSTVEVREYNQTLGDNPSVRFGPPIQLDWDYTLANDVPEDLDLYEARRGPRRRKHKYLGTSNYHRKNRLIHVWGFTPEEVRQAKRRAKTIRRQRWVSLHMSLLETTWDSAGSFTIMALSWYARAWSSSYDCIEWGDVTKENDASITTTNSSIGQTRCQARDEGHDEAIDCVQMTTNREDVSRSKRSYEPSEHGSSASDGSCGDTTTGEAKNHIMEELRRKFRRRTSSSSSSTTARGETKKRVPRQAIHSHSRRSSAVQ